MASVAGAFGLVRVAGPQCGGLEPGVGVLGVVGDGGSALEVGGAGFAVGSSVYGDAAGNHPGVADLDALKHRSCVYPFHCCPFRFENIRTPLLGGGGVRGEVFILLSSCR